MKHYELNDTEQVRTDAVNLVDHLAEYSDSGNDELANELFRDFIHHLIVNGFIKQYSDVRDFSPVHSPSIKGLSDPTLDTIHPSIFAYYLIKYCFVDNPEIDKKVDLDFPEWKFTTEILMKHFVYNMHP